MNTTETGRDSPMEQVDLERFLDSHKEDEIEFPHRTVDEILLLNDFSSSSSSSSPSPPSSPSISATATDWSELRSRSGNLSDYHTGSAFVPQLFAAVRSNAKPGAALAAAAAASRFVPAPRATSIKSARSFPTNFASSSKVLEFSTTALALTPPDDDTGQVSSSSEVIDDIIDVVRVQEEGLNGLQENPPLETGGESELLVDHRDEFQSVYSSADHFEDSPAGIQDGSEFELSSANASVKLESEGEMLESSFLDNDSITEGSRIDSAANGTASGKEIIQAADSLEGELLYEDTTTTVEQSHDLDSEIIPDDVSSTGGNEEDSITEGAVSAIMDDFDSDSRKTNNNPEPSLRPLEVAEEFEKRQAFSGMHWEEGAAARPMRLEGLRTGSTMLGYFKVDANNVITHTISSQAFRRDQGFPMVIAVQFNYIAVGMSKGLIMVTPSKYSPYHNDNMDSKTLMLGLQGDRPHVPVTSMCFNQQGDILFAGYGDGHYSVWDVQKASILKVVSEHKAPVVHMLYLGQDAQNSRQFNVVSGDSNGVMKLIRFSIVPWVNRISYAKATKLLGEKNSTVICASPLLSCDFPGGALLSSYGNTGVSTSAIGSMMGGVIGGDGGLKNSSADEGVVIFVSHQSALVAKVSPMVDVYAQIPRPDGVGENSMPYAAWKYISESNLSSTETLAVEGSETYSLLAIAWECKVQVAKLVKSKLIVYRKWTLESPATGVAWLDDQMVVVLTAVGQLCLFAKDGNMIHQTSYAMDFSRADDLISYHTYFNNTYGNPEKAHHNCLAVRGASIYILGPSHLVVSRLLSWKERIDVLRAAGDWMGALCMSLMIYDGHAHGVIDLPRSLDDIRKTVVPYLAEVILYFVVEGFSYMEVASGNQLGILDKSDESNQISGSDDPDIKEEYIRLGGIAVEFCVHIKRTDILFDEIFPKFGAARHKETFLELLEPYILKDMLGSLPPEVMQALVEHYSSKGWLQRIEQCVLHMDISSLDFNQVVRLCREHRLHGALIYLFNKGLDDFTTPLEELLAVLRDCTRETAAGLGYRILVYLKYCFKGLAFPPGHGTLSYIRLPSIRKELLQFLLRHSSSPNSWATTRSTSNGPHPNLCHLLELDTEATLDVLGCAFEENQILNSKDSVSSDMGSTEKEDRIGETQNLVQELVDVLSVILEMSDLQAGCFPGSNDDTLAMTWPSRKDVAHIFEFIAHYVSCQRAKVSRDILREILQYLTSDYCLSPVGTFGTSKDGQKKLLNLLEVVPVVDWDASNLLHMCEKADFHQVCGFIHAVRHQYLASLDSYMKSLDEPVHAFSFIHYILKQKSDEEESVAFRTEVISRIPELVKLNREGAFFLVFELFNGQGPLKMLSELKSHPESVFLYLKTLIEVHSSGTLDFSCLFKECSLDGTGRRKAMYQSDAINTYLGSLDEFLKILRDSPMQVTDEMTEIYLELLCRYERESVLKFLESLESYRVENCLRLCQDYGVIDAAAFLLERVGDVGSALSLLLSGLNDKFVMLDDAVVNKLGNPDEEFNLLLMQKEVKDLLDVVHSCVKLCQRNSPRLEPHESEYLWFQLLDSFCEPLMDSWSGKAKSTVETQMDVQDRTSTNQMDEDVEKITWKISKSHKVVNILKKLFSVFIKEIVEGMIGYIRLPTIMLKLLSDNGSQEFGDFKPTILGMLGMYDFERRILDTAKSLIEDDTYYTMSLLKKGATHGYAPRSLLCCVCSTLLSKGSHGSGLRVFSCGHAMHVQCELPENETLLGGSYSGCPTCAPRKGTERSKTKFWLGNNGTVSKTSSRSHQQPGLGALHTQDHDGFENYSSHSISRFELLNNLQKEQRSVQVENMPFLKLAPPAVYHEKVNKSNNLANGESSRGSSIEGKTKKQQLRDLKVKGSSVRFPLRSNIFGKEKKGKQ